MTPERWQQIEQLFHAAVERALADRPAFLDQACAGDGDLRRELDSLLSSHERAGNFIETPPADIAIGMMAEKKARSMLGRTLGHYKLYALLGAGGMGEVYRARDTRLGRDVAVKILPEKLADNDEAMRRFEREARAVAALSHPNILTIYDFGVDRGVTYAVTELLEGATLRERLDRSALDWREAVEIAIAVAEGLSATHVRGIIHRDLKPENIFLTQSGQVKILDFGIARVKRMVSADAETVTSTFTATTRPGLVMGTLGYMSPEQVRGEAAEAPSDIFSLGCVIYEMAGGRRPFVRHTAAETIAAILKEEPPPLPRGVGEAPAELERIVSQALRKECEERYQSAGDLLVDLKNLKLGLTANRPASDTQPETAPIVSPRQRLRLATVIAVGAAVLLLSIIAAYRILVQSPARTGASNQAAVKAARTEMMRYYLEIETDGGAQVRATGFEPIEAERLFRFHFIAGNRGYLYLIAAGENNVPTTFLTSQPDAATGVTTNLVEAGADYSFPSGAGNGIKLGGFGNTTIFTVIFSPSPLTKPHFLSAPARRQLTTDQQRELAAFWQQFGKQPPQLTAQTDGDQAVAAVTLTAVAPNNDPLIFDIPLKRQ